MVATAKKSVMATGSTPSTNKLPRTRSPNYPNIDLETAIQRTREFHEAARRHSIGAQTVATTWKYSLKSSNFRLTLAALRAFGLLNDENGGKDKLLKLAPLALDIVADYPDGSNAQHKAIKKAALTPKLHL